MEGSGFDVELGVHGVVSSLSEIWACIGNDLWCMSVEWHEW